MILKGRSQEMAAWAGRRLKTTFHPPYEAWGITDAEGAITGAVVFNDYDARNIEITVVGTGWSRKVIREIHNHCFKALKCERVSFTTRESNTLVRSLIERMGGTLEGVQRRYYGNEDAVLYGILKDEFTFK